MAAIRMSVSLGFLPAIAIGTLRNGKAVEFEEVRYGMLMMVLCDREGRDYDVWITFGSVHEVRAFRERKKRSFSSMFIGRSKRMVYMWDKRNLYTTTLKL